MTSLNTSQNSMANVSVEGLVPLLTATHLSQPENEMREGSLVSLDLNNSEFKSVSPNTAMVKNENRSLKAKIRQLQFELHTEQDQVSTVRRKLNSLERERLDGNSKYNAEISRLETEVAKLRAQLEKGEAVRENIEFELAKARKETSHEKHAANDREAILNDLNDTMKFKISELSQQVERLSLELENVRTQSNSEISLLKDSIADKNHHISTLKTDHDLVEAEKEKLEHALQQQESLTAELEERLRMLEGEKREQTDVLRKQVYEGEVVRDREERLKKDLEMAMNRIKSLEEKIEAERVAHLESKFNSEIVQLRMRDLQSALELEKSSKSEAMQTSEKLSQQFLDLQKVFEDERKTSQESRDKLEKAEKEYAILSKQLSAELEDKKSLIKKLSLQLELHQKNFDELKDELNKAKKRQIFLEETYGGSIRELEIVINSFSIEAGNFAGKKNTKTTKKKDSPPAPAVLLENLRHMLLDMRRNHDNASSELSLLKTQHETINKECAKFKELSSKHERSAQTATQNLTRANKELVSIKSELASCESQIKTLQADLKTSMSSLTKERKDNVQLKEQMMKVATKCKADEYTKMEYLHGLYQQILTGRVIGKVYDGTNLSKFTWTDLTILINEQIAILINSLLREGEKTKHLENIVATKEHMLEQMQKAHEDQIEKLASTSEERLTAWQQQKSEMEQHYSQMLGEIHSRHQKAQTMADQAWEKMKATGSLQQGLESECHLLRDQVVQLRTKQETLLATLALLTGALYPLYLRASALSAERRFLMDCLSRFLAFKEHVQMLVDALSVNKEQTLPKSPREVFKKKPKPALLRFRIAAIAVIAANRLANGTLKTCQLFVTHDTFPGIFSSIICAGGVPKQNLPFMGLGEERLPGNTTGSNAEEEKAKSWLKNNELLSTVMATMSDLHNVIYNSSSHDPAYMNHTVIKAAKSSFNKLACHWPAMFPNISGAQGGGFNGKSQLTQRLAMGLNRILAQSLMDGKHYLAGSQSIIGRLQQQLLDFTKHLHRTEVERRDLKHEVARLAHSSQNLAQSSHISHQLQEDLHHLRAQLEQSVSKERFEGVCRELQAALDREQEAEHLLTQQGQHLQEISERLDRHLQDGSFKASSISEIEKALREARSELKHQEQLVRQLNRQLKSDEETRRSLQSNLKDAEAALRTAANDKEMVTLYVKNVENSLEKVKASSTASGLLQELDLSVLLSLDLLPVSTNRTRQSPELAACQVMVATFVETQQQVNLKLRSLQDELRSHKDHINQLKQELNAAFSRHYHQQVDMRFGDQVLQEDDKISKTTGSNSDSELPVMGSPRPTKLPQQHRDTPSRKDHDFSPLVEDSSDSMNGTKTNFSSSTPLTSLSIKYKAPKSSTKMTKKKAQKSTSNK